MRKIPLIVGIDFTEMTDEERAEFSEDERGFTNSFGLGALCMIAQPGFQIEDPEEFHHRLLVTNQVTGVLRGFGPEFFTIDLVTRMKAAGWQTNAGKMSKRAWKAEMKNRLFDDAVEAAL